MKRLGGALLIALVLNATLIVMAIAWFYPWPTMALFGGLGVLALFAPKR